MIKKVRETFNVIWNILRFERKVQLILLIALSFLSSLAEVISLGAIIPFLLVLTNPEKINNFKDIPFIINDMNLYSISELQFKLTLLFVTTVAVAGIIRWLYLFYQAKFSYGIGIEISTQIYIRFLNQPFAYHISRNSSEMISTIINKSDSIISKLIYPILTITNGVILFVGILVSMILVSTKVVLVLILLFSFYYFIVSKITKSALQRFGNDINQSQTLLIKLLQEGFGNIRDIILGSKQTTYLEEFEKSQTKLKKSQASALIISLSPRYIIETFGIIFIVIIIYLQLYNNSELDSAIPVIGVMVLGAQRILPIFQQIFHSWTQIKLGWANVLDVLKVLNFALDIKLRHNELITFNKKLNLSNIKFKYPNRKNYVLKDVNLNLLKGERLGVVGSSGSGKSTFLDIMTGLISPQSGEIYIDDVKLTDQNRQSWQKCIALVPQHIFLSDTTIGENIAFGVPHEKIDLDRIAFVAKQAGIIDFINLLPDKFSTLVGERGVQLSGGQRQRIGIARALYRNVKILIFDEATSALDNETEMLVLDNIKDLSNDLTIVIVTHRLSTLSMCSRILKIENGSVSYNGPFSDFNT